MSKTLLIPIHVDALCLASKLDGIGPMADYKLLPYTLPSDSSDPNDPNDPDSSNNKANKNLGETALKPLFDGQGIYLGAGIHLHWALPDALTNGKYNDGKITFSAVPNRWLVLRTGGNLDDKQWIVESDYLYPDEPEDYNPYNDSNICSSATDATGKPIPAQILVEPPDLSTVDPTDPSTYQYKRYRYMGRSWELAEWQADTTFKEYAPALTAIGTNAAPAILDEIKATFAAFYPHSCSVFGFYDPEFAAETPPSGLQYDIIGWYSDEQLDCLQQFWTGATDEAIISDADKLLEKLQEDFGWTIESEPLTNEVQRTLYHSRLTFSCKGVARPTEIDAITIANSPSESLSAYLAKQYYADNDDIRQSVEQQLEALQISEQLESRKLDINAKFLEGQHQEGFGTENNGFLWAIMPQGSLTNGTANGPQAPQTSLPDDLAQTLNELNVIQDAYNQAQLDIESMRRQLYCQWHYCIDNEDVDVVDLSDASLIPLRTLIAQTGEIEFTRNPDKSISISAKTLHFGVISKRNDYFHDYVDAMSDEDEFNKYIVTEFVACGVAITEEQADRTVETVTEEEEWTILNEDDQIYSVKVVDGGIFTIYVPPTASFSSGSPQIAQRLVTAIQDLHTVIDTHNGGSTTQYRLAPIPAQQYWRSSDPALLFTGDAAKAPSRFGQDGRLREDNLLECYPIDVDLTAAIADPTAIQESINILLEQINLLEPAQPEDSINFITWKEQPWNPFAFQWRVSFSPSRESDMRKTSDYSATQILDNYSLEFNAIDLKLINGNESSFVQAPNSYKGFSILSPDAGTELRDRMDKYLTQHLLPSFYEENAIDEASQSPEYLHENFESIKAWYEDIDYVQGLDDLGKAQDTISVALYAYEAMQTLNSQAQVIGGLHDTFLLARPTLALQVDDLMETDDPNKFVTEQTRWTLGDSLQYEILKGDIFNPIRSGAMSIDKLWLVDSFGQYIPVKDNNNGTDVDVVTTCPQIPAQSDYHALLAPRLAQHARLNFHWLAADAPNEIEMTPIPSRNPVCGWLVPNNLDSTLGIYDQQGQTLGSLDRAGRWRSAPGGGGLTSASEIANQHLRKLVQYLIDQEGEFQQAFISTLDNALATIDPDSFAEHTSLALLLGRPIAVVRATFNLEVKGLPVCDPTVKIENADEEPITHGFKEVLFPIRLGDYQQLNDGLVGYWREAAVGGGGDYDYSYEDDIFYAPQSRVVEGSFPIQTEAEGVAYFEQTVDAPPQGVTMLIDPRGVLHATCGILPNRELRLPSENYSSALQSMEVNFLATPVLSDRFNNMLGGVTTLPGMVEPSIAIPLPNENNAVWSWVSQEGEQWSETTEIEPVNATATFSKPQQLYEGWLQLSHAEPSQES